MLGRLAANPTFDRPRSLAWFEGFARRRVRWDGILIYGAIAFLQRTEASLQLLRPLPEYDLIHAHIGCITQARRSGMKAWAEPPTFTVGTATWRHSPIWYAGAIAHDSFHAKLYRDCQQAGGATTNWTGKEAERRCLLFQRQVLSQLGAEKDLIDYINALAVNPTYQGADHGWRARLDYLRRWW